MRASRLLSILLMLQNRGRLTAEELAQPFEVSVRTIYRDIEALSAANVPVYADRGPGGGFQLLDGFRTKLTGLTESEAESLSLAGLPGPASELGLADQLLSAQLKLTAALPEKSRVGAERVARRFHLDPVDWFRSAQSAQLLPEIARAVWTDTAIDVVYRRAGRPGSGSVRRRLHPLGLVLKAGTWYVVAGVAGSVRIYRVSNILELSASDQRFVRPAKFDLVKFWTESSRAYEVGLYRGSASLRVSRRGFERLAQLGTAVAEAARASARPAGKSGWRNVEVPIESPEQAALDLMRLGAEAEVLKPPALRRRLAKLARETARMNG